MAQRIFIIEDDEGIREVIYLALSTSGYEVTQFDNAIDAIAKISANAPDLAIFDVMLPELDGMTAVKQIRQFNHDMPILMLSAKDREIDKVNGLDSGADDYLAKPFGVLELNARVRSLLRRKQSKKDVFKSSTLTIEKATRQCLLNNIVIELTKREYQLLIYLIENHQRIVERDELLNNIWGYEYVGETRVLDVHLRALRNKLGDDGTMYIKTIRGVGYRFIEKGIINE